MDVKFAKMNLDRIVYDAIRDSLIRGEYTVGQRLNIDEICERFGVSRTPTLQAIKLLVNENALEMLSNGKIIVPGYTAKQVNDIIEARLLFERYAIKQCCVMQDARIIRALRLSADNCQVYIEQGDIFNSQKEDLNFHKLLVDSANNECISDVYSKIQGRYLVANYLTQEYRIRSQNQAANDHEAFLDCLENWDFECAWKIMESHIGRTRDQIIEALELHSRK